MQSHYFGRRVSSVSHAFNHLYEMVSMFGFTFAGAGERARDRLLHIRCESD